MKKTFDPRCYDLAGFFLADHPAIYSTKAVDDLAGVIQEAVEDWIQYRNDQEAKKEQKRSWG